ncbi:hypothetical protein M9H77_35419 [Catharanthus roseus]|uniref:Uncharacterized protein n=1 Tax=Catharanthus roseus TaxID=4058 RepID=A0ACB9ZNY6_CATRO|nr:hypothetical protein M9H77_35419 [Catharanthus roseus]
MPLLEVVGMTLTGKNFNVASAFMRNEQATTYRWVLQQIKHLYFSNAMSIENQEDVCDHEPKLIVIERECGQIADIKALLEFSMNKEKNNAKSNHIFYIVSNKISHLALKKIWFEILRAAGIYDDPKNKCGHYLKTSHGLPCACKLITRFDHTLPIQLSDIEAFWKTDMDSEMRSVTDLLHQISTALVSKVREMHHLAKGVLIPVLPEDPGVTLTSPPEVAVIKGRKKKNSTKKDKSHWEHVSIAHRKIQKSSGSILVPVLDLGRGPIQVLGRDPVGEEDSHELLGEGQEGTIVAEVNVIGNGTCGYRVVADFVFGDEHQWPEVQRQMFYELKHSTNVFLNLVASEVCVNELVHMIHCLVDRPMPYKHWLETPDSLYVIANAFNLCVILIAQLSSTIVLPLYSYSNRPGATNN